MTPRDGIASFDASARLVGERLFMLSRDLMCVVDGTGELVSINRAWEAVLGWPAGELAGVCYAELVHPDDREASAGHHEDVVGGVDLVDFTNRLRKRDGSYAWILWSASVDPATGLTYAIGKDVTEREASRLDVVEHSDDAIVTKDLDLVITGWNPGAKRLYGYSAQEAIGQPIAMLIPSERDGEESAIFRRILTGERVDHFETMRVHKNGRRLDISVSVSALRDRSGRLIGASSIARDISDARSIARAQDQVIKRLLLASEFRDDDTGQHVVRMSGLCGRIAVALGWDSERAAELESAATMHDVGKIAIPDAILLKRGPLSEEERTVMETHAAVGHRMLSGSGIAQVERGAEIALTHHEHFDGRGYPNGLIGEAIPISGRIAAVADVFDALTSDRVYRTAFTEHQALGMMREGSGTHFDPTVLEALLAVLDAERRTGSLIAPDAPAEREHTADARDRAAADRDLAATGRDRAASARDRFQAGDDRLAAGRQQAQADRGVAASSRGQAAAERDLAEDEARHAAADSEQARAELRRAQGDSLSGVLGRELGMVMLGREINRARHGSGRLVLAYVDVDGLKRINDADGHSADDTLLRDVVAATARHLRSYDPIVRVGGDEFVCALGDADIEEAGERFRNIVSTIKQTHPGSSVSVGLAALEPGDSLDRLIQRADRDLGATRAAGKVPS